MKIRPIRDARAFQLVVRVVFCLAIAGMAICAGIQILGQAPSGRPSLSATQALIDKAHSLEARGRRDMAAQVWQQVLLADQNSADALDGLARVAKLAGNNQLANIYLDRMRKLNPNDLKIAQVQTLMSQQDQSAQLTQAGKLAEAGQYSRAMDVYRQVFGTQPPPGDWSLAYYETESATGDGRAHAIAGLRGLMEKYPKDSRYQVQLGRVLTYDPKTREEGRRLLERQPADPQAQLALRQSLVWDAQNPATAAEIRAYLQKHNDAELATALKNQPKGNVSPQTPEEAAAAARERALGSRMEVAYRALNGKRVEEAQERFKDILASDPSNGRALAGMGYVRMQQSNFGGAISFLEQAQQDGVKTPGIQAALSDARFYYNLAEGASALNENDLATAEKQYQAALAMRPASADALEGLGATLMKAGQPQAAIQVFERYASAKPTALAAWRGLLGAKQEAGNAAGALQTERAIPPAILAQLMKDPDFLRTLASAYSAVGRDADAQGVLRSALDLPFPADAHGLKATTLMQYAGLLQQANRLDQAGGLYRQVLASDPSNTQAWEGLVRIEHAMKEDEQAIRTLGSMPPPNYDVAMRDPGFESTVASVYQAQNKLDLAQSILEKAIETQTATGQPPSMATQTQLAGVYLAQNDAPHAFPLYRKILSENPGRTDAWKGMISTLHNSGHDQEAMVEVQQISVTVRRILENDVDYLRTVAGVYSSLGQTQQSMIVLNRLQQHYANAQAVAPADIDIQNAYLLFNGSNDAGLYRQLMMLGGREDLTDEQRRTVQTIWALWASRRANAAAAAGNDKRALAILNAAAGAFPDNPSVLKQLATGYARAGQPKQAVMIFKTQEMTSASAADYKGAVGAALAAGDTKSAEVWLRYGLERYSRDAQMLVLGAKYEQARGDMGRAADYYKASLAAMPPPDPGAELASQLSRSMPSAANRLPSQTQSQDLASLLGPGAGRESAAMSNSAPAIPAKPYLPAYGNTSGAVPVDLSGAGGMAGQPSDRQSYGSAVPSYMTNPLQPDPAYPPQQGQTEQPAGRRSGTLGNYAPPVEQPMGEYPVRQLQLLPDDHQNRSELTSAPVPDSHRLHEEAHQRQQLAQLTHPMRSTGPDGAPSSRERQAQTQKRGPLTYAPAQSVSVRNQEPLAKMDEVYGPYVPYVAPVHYSPDQRAAADGPGNPQTRNVQYVSAVEQEQFPQPQSHDLPQRSLLPSGSEQTAVNSGQQYPQPGMRSKTRKRTAPHLPQRPSIASQPGMHYPGVAQPLSYQLYPMIEAPIAPGAPPTDAELVARLVPPLRRGYDPATKWIGPPLSPRGQTERDLETIESSYGAWIGGTAFARYRSGRVGFDRLTDLEASFEASVVAAKKARFTVVAKPVFLSNGVVDTATLPSSGGVVPVLGTLPGNAIVTPAQQSASGVGGELQISTANLGLAIGYAPYEFLVSNVTGRFAYRASGGRFTLFADRDSVKETQLSYAGLRDPGSATPFYPGNVWGGVVSTGGGARLDLGSERAGFYLSGDGASITGYHVLANKKFEGTVGTYFRVKTFPPYGSLNVGGMFYGMHYSHNELGLTYGEGGYFSPQSYFLAAVPVSFTGRYNVDLHYIVSGSVGVQTFQSSSAAYFPLDRGIQTGSGNLYYPSTSNMGFSYSINSEGSYRIADHWYAGGFLTGNNANYYNAITGGFFVRYLFKPLFPTDDYPTGLFPLDGFRPLRVP